MKQQPAMFDNPIVVEQLRYTGVMETTKIRSQGFAVRLKFADFIEQYKILAFKLTETIKPNGFNCSQILAATDLDGWQIGNTKVFMKYHHRTSLVEKMERYNKMASMICRAFQCYQARQLLVNLREARRAEEAQERARAVQAEQQRRQELLERDAAAAAAATTAQDAHDAHDAQDLSVPNSHDDLLDTDTLQSGGVEAPSTAAAPSTGTGTDGSGADTPDRANRSDPVAAAAAAAAAADDGNPGKSSGVHSIIRATDPKEREEKHGTITKGDVGARLLMFQNAIRANEAGSPDESHHQGTLTRGINVGSAAKSFKLDLKKMMPPKSFKAGPAMPPVMPWREKKVCILRVLSPVTSICKHCLHHQ